MSESNRLNDQESASDISEAIRAEFDWSDVAPSTAVVETVATAANRDQMALEPLYHTVDPDALDNLLRSGDAKSADGSTTVTFTFQGHEVTAQREGTILVRPINSPLDPE